MVTRVIQKILHLFPVVVNCDNDWLFLYLSRPLQSSPAVFLNSRYHNCTSVAHRILRQASMTLVRERIHKFVKWMSFIGRTLLSEHLQQAIRMSNMIWELVYNTVTKSPRPSPVQCAIVDLSGKSIDSESTSALSRGLDLAPT